MLSETTPVTWKELTKLLSTTAINGWNISRHEVVTQGIKNYTPGSKKYLYVMTKDGHRRVNTGEWQEVRKTIDLEAVKTLF